jgi:hypothetical protein
MIRLWTKQRRSFLSCFGWRRTRQSRPRKHLAQNVATQKAAVVWRLEDKFKTGCVVRKLRVELFEGIFHFFVLAFLKRAMTPSCATANGSVLPCSHSQSVRAGTSSSVAASACVKPRRVRSDLIKVWNVMLLGFGKCARPPIVALLASDQPPINILFFLIRNFLRFVLRLASGTGDKDISAPICLNHIFYAFIFHILIIADSANEVNNYLAESANCYNPLITNDYALLLY